MFTLSNSSLTIELLDPVTDLARLGARFCWGGFIWQIHDRQAGPLLSGPEWPKADPTPWNAQGLPEAFRHRTRLSQPLTWREGRGVALGAGELAVQTKGEVVVTRPCVWRIVSADDHVLFHTRQQTPDFDYEIERRISIAGRTLFSMSRLTNHHATPLTLEWFAHPFFPLADGLITADFPAGTGLAENPGFALNGRQLSLKRRFLNQQDGHLDYALLPAGQNLVAQLSHPKLSHVNFTTSFPPSECLVWGNNNTFSIEPYQLLALASGEMKEWHLRYDFGSAV